MARILVAVEVSYRRADGRRVAGIVLQPVERRPLYDDSEARARAEREVAALHRRWAEGSISTAVRASIHEGGLWDGPVDLTEPDPRIGERSPMREQQP